MEPIISDEARSTGTDLRRAAQYVRVSTEHQRYAIQNQINALNEYAERHGIEIVRTYADQGKSGLSLAKRDALKQLLQDVMSNAADFSITLHELRLMITKTTAENIRRNGQHVVITKRHTLIIIEGSITINFMVTQQHAVKSGKKYWQICPSRKSRIDIVAVALMDDENKNIVTYFILPRDEIKPKTIRLFEENRPSIEIYRADSLDPICVLAAYGKIHDKALNELIIEAIRVTEANLPGGATDATNDNGNASKANSPR